MRLRLFSALFAALLAPGCVMVQVGVTNPIPGLSTVAVAPFLNLSAERAVDGRRFALAYASELQKVPGFDVLPVGVTEVAMVDGKIDLNDVDEVLKLAKILRVDAIVVGAVTDYSPYYPPRIGMPVNWYSPQAVVLLSGNSNRAGRPGPAPAMGPTTAAAVARLSEAARRTERSRDTGLDGLYHWFQHWPVIRNLYGEPSLRGRHYPQRHDLSGPIAGPSPPASMRRSQAGHGRTSPVRATTSRLW